MSPTAPKGFDPRKVKNALRMPADFLTRRLASRARIGRPGRVSPEGSSAAPRISFFPARPLTRNLWLFIWLVVVIMVAQIVMFVNPIAGVYVNAAALCSLLGLALWQERARQLIITVGIIPLAMLVGMSLPSTTLFQRTVSVSVIILILGLVYQYLFTLDYPKEGTKLRGAKYGYLIAIPAAIVVGQLIGLVGFGFMHGHYEFRDTPLVMVFLGMAVLAISEEVLFRGLIQQRAFLIFHPVMATILAATLYTLMTIGHTGSPFAPVIGALIGAATSYAYYKKQNLLLPIAINLGAKVTFVGLVAVFVLR